MHTQIRKLFLVLSAVLSVSLFVGCDFSIKPPSVEVVASTTKNHASVYISRDFFIGGSLVGYYIYYNTINNPSTAQSVHVGTEGSYCDIYLSTSGTYYFWVKSEVDSGDGTYKKSDYSTVVSYDFTYTPPSPPTGVNVASLSTSDNRPKVTWTDDHFASHWIYYNTTPDTSSAQCRKTTSPYCIVNGLSTGTYYFWVKSADGTSSTSATSDFSSVVTYTKS